MPAEITVADASVVAALLFAEPRADEAADLIAGSFLVAPTLLRYEIGSVCLKKLRRYPDQRAALLEAHAMLDLLGIQEVDVPLRTEVLLLAEREALTVYDAAYLWLARSLRAQLVTFDQALARASGS
jgi:predicted nucleic acid-binding protein